MFKRPEAASSPGRLYLAAEAGAGWAEATHREYRAEREADQGLSAGLSEAVPHITTTRISAVSRPRPGQSRAELGEGRSKAPPCSALFLFAGVYKSFP